MYKSDLFSTSLIAAIASVLMMAIVFVVSVYLKSKSSISATERYNVEKGRMELEYMREKIERQAYEINQRLEATEKRWKDVNHLIISSQSRGSNIDSSNFSTVKLNEFLSENGIQASDISIDKDLVFYLTPFSKEFAEDFESVYNVCRTYGLKCLRGDEEFISGDVFPFIIKSLVKARIVIANISGRNPNVFYELGIAHALSKPTIIISRNLSDASFDVRTKQIILYHDSSELKESLRLALARTFAKEQNAR